jgi:uncharacterized protein YbjT (DUF2867 family)
MIVVTGATGNVGSPLVRALAEAGEQVTAVSRRAAEVPAGVRHVQADLTDPQSLTPALAGADVVFLLNSAGFHTPGDLEKVVAAIREQGIGRVVLLSSQGVGTGRHSPALEEVVQRSGLDWTILRPGGFHSNALQWIHGGTYAAPFADVALPSIDPADIAAVAAVVLRSPDHIGQTYELTGPALISPREQAAAIAGALGTEFPFVELTAAQAKEGMVRHMPEPVADATLVILSTPWPAEQRVGEDVSRLLGRPAAPFADWSRRNVAAFR